MFISSWYIFGYTTQNRLDLPMKSCTAKNSFLFSESCNSKLTCRRILSAWGQVNETVLFSSIRKFLSRLHSKKKCLVSSIAPHSHSGLSTICFEKRCLISVAHDVFDLFFYHHRKWMEAILHLIIILVGTTAQLEQQQRSLVHILRKLSIGYHRIDVFFFCSIIATMFLRKYMEMN